MTSPFSSAKTTFVPLSSNSLINGLLNHDLLRWGSGSGVTLSYSFPWSSSATAMWSNNYGAELTATQHFGFNQTQIAAATAALQAWSNVANITFTYTADTATNVGDFRFAFSSAVDPWWGWSSYPNSYSAKAADVWVNPENANEGWSPGSYNFNALMHEIGHGLGLQHPFGEAINLPSNLNVRNYTIMSYTDPGNVWFWDGSQFQYSIKTPMVYDILAIQYLYGANNSFHTGNDVYHFSASEGIFETIWDAGGVDTIDVSQFTTNCSINLTPGSYSSLPLSNWSVKDNIGIAFGAVIENAIGGSGNDKIAGNSANNIIDGGAGLDTVVYSGRRADFGISVGANSITVSGAGTDTIAHVERIQFSDSILAFDIQGNAGNAYRLYQAAFNRTPDTPGLSFWTHALDQGVDILTVARGFVQSSEFRSVYGVQPSNASIVDHLYYNVLHRAGEPEGVAFWTRGLDNGLPIADLLQGFAVSSENHSLVDPKIAQGIVLDTSAFLV